MNALSKPIHSNQQDVHEKLFEILEKHRQNPFRKPIARHTEIAFEFAEDILASSGKEKLILDSGCGVGESTINLAKLHPDAFVLGIDKSEARLRKILARQEILTNYVLIRADLIDFWRLAARAKWRVDKHYILYPNPWPKKRDIKKRFYAHPVFWDLIQLGQEFELRSNWKLYLQEFALAFAYATGKKFEVEQFVPHRPISPFERKYLASGHTLYKLILRNESG